MVEAGVGGGVEFLLGEIGEAGTDPGAELESVAGAGGGPVDSGIEFSPEEIGVCGVGVQAGLGIDEFGDCYAETTLGEVNQEVEFFLGDGAFGV